jgi:hypothetical protein
MVSTTKHPSDYHQLSTVRSVSELVNRVLNVCQPFIGKGRSVQLLASLKAAVDGVIKASVSDGIVMDAQYTLELGTSFDTIKINMQVVPTFEVRIIDVSVGLADKISAAA